MSEHFIGLIEVEEVVIVNDHRFVIPDTEDVVDVRPVMLKDLMSDSEVLKHQKLYLYPSHDDAERKVFFVYYERFPDK